MPFLELDVASPGASISSSEGAGDNDESDERSEESSSEAMLNFLWC